MVYVDTCCGITPDMVSLLRHKPATCPLGHELGRGAFQLGWMPCGCAAVREAAETGTRGYGHYWIRCNECGRERCATVFYEPPHDTAFTNR